VAGLPVVDGKKPDHSRSNTSRSIRADRSLKSFPETGQSLDAFAEPKAG
jgi:hypothetical protein